MTTAGRRSYESLAQAAERTGISTKTLRRHIAAGALTAYRCGRLIRLDPDDVDRMMVRVPNGR
ncbi:helix-turn-helix domain-containing protein [Phycicoccus sp.]|uniref:helix-turn-helix domain-containing protein n=1 Tax=Phycicoccus sp. TaxID=1902410 RepID=UPI002BFBE803|nr:helix-turn-helix domain-containing protein [Phycicoccus sp.]HMM96125.1 helix-turn-helix domain-containing protein [Phycicoccus sp.]